MRLIERETIVKWNVDCTEIDPQEIQHERAGGEELGEKNWEEYSLEPGARSITVTIR
jgi:hypothetical protein